MVTDNERQALLIQAQIDSGKELAGVKKTERDGYCGAMLMAMYKDGQVREKMLGFFKWLDKRGFLKDDLQFDYEHQLDTYLETGNEEVIL